MVMVCLPSVTSKRIVRGLTVTYLSMDKAGLRGVVNVERVGVDESGNGIERICHKRDEEGSRRRVGGSVNGGEAGRGVGVMCLCF